MQILKVVYVRKSDKTRFSVLSENLNPSVAQRWMSRKVTCSGRSGSQANNQHRISVTSGAKLIHCSDSSPRFIDLFADHIPV